MVARKFPVRPTVHRGDRTARTDDLRLAGQIRAHARPRRLELEAAEIAKRLCIRLDTGAVPGHEQLLAVPGVQDADVEGDRWPEGVDEGEVFARHR